MIHNSIQTFIHATEVFDQPEKDIVAHLDKMHAWHQQLARNLNDQRLNSHGLTSESSIALDIATLNTQLDRYLNHWETQSDTLHAAQSVADHFDDKIILLIFGKFNAGKSSLCNVLAECFHRHQQSVEYFYLEDGKIVESQDRLKEGATETTTRLQGVCLGKNLILLDTPGLYSVTPENADLTQRFLDSADGVLWLSSSSSPGQVKELAALGQELRRHKPLLPVITRSDYFEEDEVNGEICQVLCNKNAEQRDLQENDVHTRATDQLIEMHVDPSLLQFPISTSSQMLKNADFNNQEMLSAGFNRLFNALLHLIQPALAYKQRKPAEALLHHLQEQILMPLQMELVPQLNQLQQDLNHARDTLIQSKEQIITQTWRGIIATLPGLLEQFAEQQAVDELYSTLTQQTEQLLSQQISDILVDYQLQNLPFEALQFAEHLTYEVIYADDAKEILAIGHDRLYAEISQTLWQKLDVYTDKIITQSQSVLSHIQDQIETVQQDLINDEQELQYIAQHLRMKDLEQA
ncbi:dynamin family protein [Acinetobacter venetianus]|uniref:dynamin family protein n=1 Tax=Acinetobacter venetianus TaxID=52133 RepID=UPI00214F89BA|nr:dynamin family protein [Acinetobacter venetianus]MCR4532508.1 50S ribosome-binding GTPase [Acinetobacter venetianus]